MYIRKYRIRIRQGEAGNYGVYTVPYNTYNYTNTVLANPKYLLGLCSPKLLSSSFYITRIFMLSVGVKIGAWQLGRIY